MSDAQVPRSSAETAPSRPPTRREIEVLRAVIAEGGVARAARILGCSPHTIDRHLDELRNRLGVATTLQAVHQLTRDGCL